MHITESMSGTVKCWIKALGAEARTNPRPCLISMELTTGTHEYLKNMPRKLDWDWLSGSWDMAVESQKSGHVYLSRRIYSALYRSLYHLKASHCSKNTCMSSITAIFNILQSIFYSPCYLSLTHWNYLCYRKLVQNSRICCSNLGGRWYRFLQNIPGISPNKHTESSTEFWWS